MKPQWIHIALLCVLFAAGTKLRLDHADDLTDRSPDEKYYAAYAERVARNGLAEFPVLVAEYIADPALQVMAPPWRVGYVWPLAAWMKLAGSLEIRSGAWLSLAVSLATLALLGFIGARYLPPPAALCAMLTLAVLIPDLAIARRNWSDGFMSGLGLLIAWAAWRIIQHPRRYWPHAVLVLAGTMAGLVKETGAVVLGACLLFAAVSLARRRDWRAVAWLALDGLAAALLCLSGLILAAGGIAALRATWHMQQLGFARNTYDQVFQSGPWSGMIKGFWILAPVPCVLGTLGVCLALLPDRWLARLAPSLDPPASCLLRLLAGLSITLVAVILLLANAQNFRYLSPLHAPLSLLAGLALAVLLDFARHRLARPAYWATAGALTLVLIGAAITDYQRFERIYVVDQQSDLSIKMVLSSTP